MHKLMGIIIIKEIENKNRTSTIRFTLLYFKMAIMPLVPETKMADVGKQISLGDLLARKTMWLVLTTTPATSILSRDFGAYCMTKISINTLIFQHSFSFYCNFQREHSLSILTNKINTLFLFFYIWLPAVYRHENVYSLQPFSSLLYSLSETFSSLEHRNFVKPQKERNSRNT